MTLCAFRCLISRPQNLFFVNKERAKAKRQDKAEEMVDFNLILFRNTLDRSTKFND